MTEETDPTFSTAPAAGQEAQVEDGVALCLSGGGYRAMLFHAGSLWRLHELGLLSSVKQISSVSGGSITAAQLALSWDVIHRSGGDPAVLESQLVMPLRALANSTIDIPSIILGLFTPGGGGPRIAKAYDRKLFNGATLQQLPDNPAFVINSTNVQSGALWRFRKSYMRDHLVGEVKRPATPLSYAVAASSAFPPFLSPFHLSLREEDFTDRSGSHLQRAPFTTRVLLTDGGVYDNLGLETAWKRYNTILVSDGGGKMEPQARPWRNWPFHARRVLDLVDNQVRSLRKRHLIAAYEAPRGESTHRFGAYWGIRTDIRNYGLDGSLPCPPERTLALADIPTRLGRISPLLQERLINWGYAVTDAAVRRPAGLKHLTIGGMTYFLGLFGARVICWPSGTLACGEHREQSRRSPHSIGSSSSPPSSSGE